MAGIGITVSAALEKEMLHSMPDMDARYLRSIEFWYN